VDTAAAQAALQHAADERADAEVRASVAEQQLAKLREEVRVLRGTLDSVDIEAVRTLQKRLAHCQSEVVVAEDKATAATERASDAMTKCALADARAAVAEQKCAELETTIATNSSLLTGLTELQDKAQQQLAEYQQQLSEQSVICDQLMQKLRVAEEEAATSAGLVSVFRRELVEVRGALAAELERKQPPVISSPVRY